MIEKSIGLSNIHQNQLVTKATCEKAQRLQFSDVTLATEMILVVDKMGKRDPTIDAVIKWPR